MATPQLDTERLRLTPLRVTDAREMLSVLGDDALYTFTGDHAPGLDELEATGVIDSDGEQIWEFRLTG